MVNTWQSATLSCTMQYQHATACGGLSVRQHTNGSVALPADECVSGGNEASPSDWTDLSYPIKRFAFIEHPRFQFNKCIVSPILTSIGFVIASGVETLRTVAARATFASCSAACPQLKAHVVEVSVHTGVG